MLFFKFIFYLDRKCIGLINKSHIQNARTNYTINVQETKAHLASIMIVQQKPENPFFGALKLYVNR